LGARRSCHLSTGEMPEVITRYEPGRCLEFRVLSTPPTMKELNPFHAVEARHLVGYYECLRGRFTLTRLPDGSTELTGTSWYRHRLAPALYWNLWTDEIVHEVHGRVLGAIQRRFALNSLSKS